MKTRVAIIARTLLSATIALFGVGVGQSLAEVQLDLKDPTRPALFVYGVISKSDGDYVAQHEADFKSADLSVYLNSDDGDVAAAMKIGRIIRHREASVLNSRKCFSSCALVYIAGVTRFNATDGVIGLHRPYLATSLKREAVEQAAPLMLKTIKDYVREMGVSDAFYDAMVNTEVSEVRLYHGDEIKRLVPETDPTYDEIDNAYDARKYGVSAGEMRRRKLIAKQKCEPLFSNADVSRWSSCQQAIYWGPDIANYQRGAKNGFPECSLSEDELKIYRLTDIKKRRDLPQKPAYGTR
jgi:ATP-dependent protease ClpP protease subunit